MPAITVTLTAIARDEDGKIRVRFGKRELEFQNLAALQSYVTEKLDIDTVGAIALRIAMDRAPNNPEALIGHSVTVDTSLNSWGKVT
jgi:hypothetical protein